MIAQEIASLTKACFPNIVEMNENNEVKNILLVQENEILKEQEELLAIKPFLCPEFASEKEIEHLRAGIVEFWQHGQSETENASL